MTKLNQLTELAEAVSKLNKAKRLLAPFIALGKRNGSKTRVVDVLFPMTPDKPSPTSTAPPSLDCTGAHSSDEHI